MMDFDCFFVEVDVNSIIDISSTEEEVKKRKMIAYMIECIDDLTERQQQRLTKHYLLGQTKMSIAREEQVSEGAIRKSINQSLFQLRRKMMRYYTLWMT